MLNLFRTFSPAPVLLNNLALAEIPGIPLLGMNRWPVEPACIPQF